MLVCWMYVTGCVVLFHRRLHLPIKWDLCAQCIDASVYNVFYFFFLHFLFFVFSYFLTQLNSPYSPSNGTKYTQSQIHIGNHFDYQSSQNGFVVVVVVLQLQKNWNHSFKWCRIVVWFGGFLSFFHSLLTISCTIFSFSTNVYFFLILDVDCLQFTALQIRAWAKGYICGCSVIIISWGFFFYVYFPSKFIFLFSCKLFFSVFVLALQNQ